MNESLPSADPGSQRRRSTRITQAVPITVSGVDALGQPFKERTTTVTVNCHGCKYQSKHYVPKNSVVTLEIPRMEPAFPPRVIQGHVVWVQRPRTVRELFQIGLEIETAGNVWDIAFPPDDWFPYPDEPKPSGPSSPETIQIVAGGETKTTLTPHAPLSPEQITVPENADPGATPVALPTGAGAAPGPHPASSSETKIRVMPSPNPPPADTQGGVARQMAQIVAEAKESLGQTLRNGAQLAISEEMAHLRQQLDAEMHETVERAIKASMDRLAESEVKQLVQQVANKAAAIVEEARAKSEAQIAQIDAKVREAVQQATAAAAEQAEHRTANQVAAATEDLRRTADAQLQLTEERTRKAVQEAVDHAAALTAHSRRTTEEDLRVAEESIRKAAEDAARLAANRAIQQTVAQDLRDRVEEVLDRVIAEREAKVPSLQVLASPEAAQAHLEEWKTSLDEAAQDVQQRTLEQIQTEEQRAMRESRERFEAVTRDSSAQLSEKLSEVSQAMLSNTGKEISDRTSALRMLLNDMISLAETSIHSLGVGLSQKHTQAEQARANLEEAAKSAVEITHQRMTQIAAEQHETMGHRVDALVADRLQSVDPLLRNAAQNVMERFSGEIEHKVAAQVDEAHQTISAITEAAGRAAEAHAHLNEKLQDAANQAAQIQGSIQDRVQQASEASLQKSLAEIAAAQQEVSRSQSEFQQQARQLSEELAQNKAAALEYVQLGADQSVQQALAKLDAANQETGRLQESIRLQIEQASAQVTLIQNTTREKIQKESESAMQKATAELALTSQEIGRLQDSVRVQKQAVSELVDEAEREIRKRIQDAASGALQTSVSELQNTLAEAEQLQSSVREQALRAEAEFAQLEERVRHQVRTAAELEARESLDRFRQEASKLPSELESVCRASISRMEEELEQKRSDLQHSAHEALLKTSEWYQKKAQTAMQSTMERLVEQSSNTMRDKAGEISNMVAAELDHYRRSYIDHGKLEFDEAAKETVARERQRLTEAGEIASATFTNRTQQILHEALEHFEQNSHESIERAHAQMKHQEKASLHHFQTNIDEKLTQAAEHAATYLQSQMVPLLESWEEKRQVEQQEWMENLKQSADESIAAYKGRLENTTNAWLLASAATLGQNSQAVLDSLAKAAEKQLRETCSRVLVGMADVFKDRLMGISTAFTSPDSGTTEKDTDKT